MTLATFTEARDRISSRATRPNVVEQGTEGKGNGNYRATGWLSKLA